jgi:peptidoglycan biosynthesis protein MviN/MurJ (putative lipid II flippase)
MTSLKRYYAFSLVGWAVMFFGLGWMSIDYLLPVWIPNLTWLGVGITTTGLAIVISTLRNLKKIDFAFEVEN